MLVPATVCVYERERKGGGRETGTEEVRQTGKEREMSKEGDYREKRRKWWVESDIMLQIPAFAWLF